MPGNLWYRWKHWMRHNIATRTILRAASILGIVAVWVGYTAPMPKIFAPVGQTVRIPWHWAIPVTLQAQMPQGLEIDHHYLQNHQAIWTPMFSSLAVRGSVIEHGALEAKLFGWLPWRSIPVDIAHPVYALPGGESIGVLVHLRGIIVTGFRPILQDHQWQDPAQSAGIDRG
ncbi:MAG: hypothetical protein OWS74_08945, partial [Firmicutes bacterium]|nr:hypothetical protein [Bacillota bacterium]